MIRPIPVKLIFAVALVAAMIVAAVGLLRQPAGGSFSEPGQLTAQDKVWLKERLARPPMPAPRPHQRRVFLLWRAPIDADRVRNVIQLVDYPLGLHGVYGMDIASTDALANTVHARDIEQTLPAEGAWLVVLDSLGRRLGATPIITPATVREAFELARGQKVELEGSEDPYLNKPAPDFVTRTIDGAPFQLSSLKGKKVILTFYCGCDYCRAMATSLGQAQRAGAFKGVEFYEIGHMQPDHARSFSRDTGQHYTGLVETESGVASMYNSVTCPRVWYIGADGNVKYYSHRRELPPEVLPALIASVKGN